MKVIPFILLAVVTCCAPTFGQSRIDKEILIAFHDSLTDEYGYKNLQDEIIIPLGKYNFCFTDTFVTYAIVSFQQRGFVAIDKNENVLYEVFAYDNSPDENSDGLFRIIKNGKIGFADVKTGKVTIEPLFNCANRFEDGKAKVSVVCQSQNDGEHSTWTSEKWYYINANGKKTNPPAME